MVLFVSRVVSMIGHRVTRLHPSTNQKKSGCLAIMDMGEAIVIQEIGCTGRRDVHCRMLETDLNMKIEKRRTKRKPP